MFFAIFFLSKDQFILEILLSKVMHVVMTLGRGLGKSGCYIWSETDFIFVCHVWFLCTSGL